MVVSILGLLLVGAAAAANQAWLDRHFLPSFLVSRLAYVRLETGDRAAESHRAAADAAGRRRDGPRARRERIRAAARAPASEGMARRVRGAATTAGSSSWLDLHAG